MFNTIKNTSSLVVTSNKQNFYSKFNNLNNHFFLTNNIMLLNSYPFLNLFISNIDLLKKSIFSIFVRKNHYFRLNRILKFRKYISFFLHLNNYKFKFNLFFKFVLTNKLTKISNKLKLKLKLKNSKISTFFKFFFLNYNKYFYKNWNILVGNFIPSSSLDLFSKKKWIRKNKNFSFVINRFVTKNKTKNKNSFLINNRKILINKFFYLNNRNTFSNYSILNHLIKNNYDYSVSKKNNYDFFLSRPYLFLNNFKIFKNLKKHSNLFLLNSYKKHSRLFNSVRRVSISNKIRSYNSSIFQNFFSVTDFVFKSNKNRNFLNVKSFFSWFSIFSSKNPNSFNLRKKCEKKISFYSWLIFSSSKTKVLKKNKFYPSSRLKLTKFVALIKFSKKVKKNNLYIKTFNIRKKILNFNFKNTTWSSEFLFRPFKSFLLNTNFVLRKPIFYKFIWKSNIIKLFKTKIFTFKNYYRKTSFSFSAIINNCKKPFYISKNKTIFVLGKYGFIFTNGSYLRYLNKTNFFYNFKKNMFSFSYKNEVQKFILRKYVKTNFFTNTFNLPQNSNLLNNSFFFNFKNFNLTDCLHSVFSDKKSELFSSILQNIGTTNWSYFNTQVDYSSNNEKDNINFNIKRVKFKPGYMTTWREARSVLKTSLFLKIKYQYKLTNYLSKYKKFINFKTFLFMEMRLINILIKSRLFNNFNISNFFLKNNLIFLNGYLCNNANMQIFCGDFIQLIINLKYYILYRWFLNLSLKKKNKLKNVLKKKHTNFNQLDDKKKSYSLPKWVLHSKNIIDDVPSFLEIDYFTLSLFVLYEPFNWNDLNSYNLIEQKFSIINLYNWKYIT